MGILSALHRGLQSRTDFVREYYRMGVHVNRAVSSLTKTEPFPMLNSDWDNLLILDGCRYDIFADNVNPPTLKAVTSGGSESWEFMDHYFVDRVHHDTVYITANPHVDYLSETVFHSVISLLDDHWDSDHNTVLPASVTEQAIQAAEDYPEKRLIVHYMQPHYPFLGPAGQEIDAQLDATIGDPTDAAAAYNIWYDIVLSGVSQETLRTAYRENFEIVWPEVRRAIDILDGKTVVTADHGNMIGELTFPVPMPGYGHPRGYHHSGVRKVPWAVYPVDQRRTIVSEPPKQTTDTEQSVLKDRLKDLGYR